MNNDMGHGDQFQNPIHNYDEVPVNTTESNDESGFSQAPSVPVTGNSQSAAVLRLQPMSIGDIFSHILTLYKEYGLIALQAMGVIYLPVIVGSGISALVALVAFSSFPVINAVISLGTIPFQFLGTIAAPAVIAKIVSDSFLSKEVDLWESLDFIWQRTGTIISASIAGGLMWTLAGSMSVLVFGLTMMAIKAAGAAAGMGGLSLLAAMAVGIGGILTFVGIAISMMFTTIVAVIEGKSWFDAPRRSIELAYQSPGALVRLAVVSVSISMLTFIIGMALAMPVSIGANVLGVLIGLPAIGQICNIAVNLFAKIILTPIAAAAPVFLYYDHRIRYENFSLDELKKNKTLI